MDPILYGHNPEESIVAVHQLNDQYIRLYKRIEGKIQHRDVEFFPFFLLADPNLLDQFEKSYWIKELSGTNYFRYIVAFSRWSEMWEAIHSILREYNRIYKEHAATFSEIPSLLVRNDAVRQYLLQSGTTLFKGIHFDELVRIQIDVQYGKPIQNAKKKRLSHQLRCLTILKNDGSIFTYDTIKNDEEDALNNFVAKLNEIDPDIIEGYQLYSKKLPLLIQRAEELTMSLPIGRDGSVLRLASSRMPMSSSEMYMNQFEIFGRHFIDLETLAESYVGSKRGLQSHALLYLAKRFGISSDHEVVSQNTLDLWWKDTPKHLLTYSEKQATLAQSLSTFLLTRHFSLAQICPFNLTMLTQLGPIARIESIMLREYIRQRCSIPRPQPMSQTFFNNAEVLQSGLFKNVLHVEIESLYSSVISTQGIKSSSDIISLFPHIVCTLQQIITSDTNTYDQGIQSENPEQWSYKYLLDHLHVYLSSARGIFNDPNQSRVIHDESIKVFESVLQQLEKFNASVIQYDRETLFIILPDNVIGETNEETFIQRLKDVLPSPVCLSIIGKYKSMLSQKKRSYALLDQKDNIVISGSTLVPRASEYFLRQFALRSLGCILTEDFTRLHHLYSSYYTMITQHKWSPKDFCKMEIIKQGIQEYERSLQSGDHAPSPMMEAVRRAQRYVREGEEIYYFISGSQADVKLTESSVLAEDWNPNFPNENTAYYVDRLAEVTGRFKDFFDPVSFEQIFTIDDLFGFSLKVSPLLKSIQKEAPSVSETPPSPDELGIWLAEMPSAGEER